MKPQIVVLAWAGSVDIEKAPRESSGIAATKVNLMLFTADEIKLDISSLLRILQVLEMENYKSLDLHKDLILFNLLYLVNLTNRKLNF
ncbi:hypothetical protein C7B64_20760 [Merismopedia glauca CCAP 1448/3]|uniref:Uncharacterized protein n=1 Tax=Merismopedia glauca CCAP 1448/3 TaxID=1296344 RepID=A0A2T1BY64_9CYAN|nr:hypothetical protein C7B64_20760 [Merismopedia glauca CCAP 1448/3]